MPEGKINFEIKGDSGIYRLSIRSLPAPQLKCNCPAGKQGAICKHILEILRGDLARCINLTAEQKNIINEMLASESFKEIIERQVEQIDFLEIEYARIKKEIARRKKILFVTLLGK